MTPTCQEVLGRDKHDNKECISIETRDKIQKRKNKKIAINNSQTRTEKVRAQAEYSQANEQMGRSNRTDKQKYVEDLATKAERAATEGNINKLYETMKKLAAKCSKP
ncbi:unnamed protein product [Schistosoma margrebowiei]|uniref:Uncharacterized protein n=1 Tax=Schistosoma margrebowiei TaxID=48269 RepID=A0A183LJJ9_9TREM|nr:unnamed protein product [Schistosoma margrebowiei]